MNDTPRTDAEVVRYYGHDMINADFARGLEREMEVQRAVFNVACDQRDEAVAKITELSAKLASQNHLYQMAIDNQQRFAEDDKSLRADKARIDWLETQDCWLGLKGEFEIKPKIAAGRSYRITVRDAIDAAMKPKPTAGK